MTLSSLLAYSSYFQRLFVPVEKLQNPVAILFDIDGTLIDSGGSGGRALLKAVSEEFQVPATQMVRLHGRTDLGIMTELLTNYGIEATSENRDRLSRRYFELLPAELVGSPGCILPGVEALLAAVSAAAQFHIGLLTGNMSVSARAKLDHFGLWDYFSFGIFGDAADHRPLLSEPALRMVREQGGTEFAAERVVVVGDTPLDVELAAAMGSRCLAVCTGGFGREALQAAGPCVVVDDLCQTKQIVNWFLQDIEF